MQPGEGLLPSAVLASGLAQEEERSFPCPLTLWPLVPDVSLINRWTRFLCCDVWLSGSEPHAPTGEHPSPGRRPEDWSASGLPSACAPAGPVPEQCRPPPGQAVLTFLSLTSGSGVAGDLFL